MANKSIIDRISYGGVDYEFADSYARNNLSALSTRVTNLNNSQTAAITTERERAVAAESALENSKVSKVAGKQLSTNDFTDDYKDLLDNPVVMSGATASTDGSQGDVPAPEAGEEEKYLKGDGTWDTPHDTTYDDATQSVHGLMSTTDKTKLDALEPEPDEYQSSSVTWNSAHTQATETLGNGRTKTTTFNQNGTITEVITKSGVPTITLVTTFNKKDSRSSPKF